MRHRHKGLITLNVLLLVALAAVSLAPDAGAQNAADRPRGSYTIATGDLRGANADAIFIIDSSNQEVVAMRYSESAKSLEGIDYAPLTPAANRGGAR
jgi:hypothetical protein